MASGQQPDVINVTVEVDGESYTGTYTVTGGTVRVSYGVGGKATQVGNSTPASIARLLLRELVAEVRRRGDQPA